MAKKKSIDERLESVVIHAFLGEAEVKANAEGDLERAAKRLNLIKNEVDEIRDLLKAEKGD